MHVPSLTEIRLKTENFHPCIRYNTSFMLHARFTKIYRHNYAGTNRHTDMSTFKLCLKVKTMILKAQDSLQLLPCVSFHFFKCLFESGDQSDWPIGDGTERLGFSRNSSHVKYHTATTIIH